jgi:hypothetical protein
MTEINLAVLTNDGQVHNLAGHDRGTNARAKFELDKLDESAERVTVVVPEDIYLLSPSFIQGMFARSVQKLGGREAFLNHYGFDATSLVMTQIESGIGASLMKREPLVRN